MQLIFRDPSVLEPQDYVKQVFQAMFGVGHAVPSTAQAEAYIERESADILPDPALLTEPISEDWTRVHLAGWKAAGLSPALLADLMCRSAALPVTATRADLVAYCRSADIDGFRFTRDALMVCAHTIADDETILPSHSRNYHDSVDPHYRLIHQRYARLIPLLTRLPSSAGQKPFIIGIDGPCASGKTTLAADLSGILHAPLIHMDDFFTPFELKTPERLAKPGGNAHTERFAEEVGIPLMTTGRAAYRPWCCSTGDYGEPVQVPDAPVIIVEGSYCLHPENRLRYDARVFVQAGLQVRLDRIRRRDGDEQLQRFLNRWIPMEDMYFDAYSLPDQDCLIVQG